MCKIIKFIAVLAILLSLCGCARYFDNVSTDIENSSTQSNTVEESVIEPTEKGLDDALDKLVETEPVEEVKWDIPTEDYIIDITREAQTDHEKLAWAIYLEGGADSVCDDCRRRIADVILNLTECKITNTGNDLYWPDTLTGVLSGGGINPYKNMGNCFRWPDTAQLERERHAVERAYRIAYEVLTGNHSEIYRKGYFYYAGANAYGYEPDTAIHHCGIFFMRQRGWDNSKFEQDWFFNS